MPKQFSELSKHQRNRRTLLYYNSDREVVSQPVSLPNVDSNSIDGPSCSSTFEFEEPEIEDGMIHHQRQAVTNNWANEFQINQNALTSLLRVLSRHGHDDLPRDARTLLNTPRSSTRDINRLQPEHHLQGISVPFELISVPMVSHFPIDYMHNTCLDINKQLLKLRIDRPKTSRVAQVYLNILSNALTNKYAHLLVYFVQNVNILYGSQNATRRSESEDEFRDTLQNVVSDTLLNAKAIKLCLYSTTILSMLSNKEGTAEDQKKLNTYMSKLFILNDNIMATEEAIKKATQIQLDLKIECQKLIFEHAKFLKE
ncbi:hypothetical protein ALC57_18289 [Trachymyrmex cornetzi]|uniref:Uncharacterized protein n=1 Tax=Trachymyrmex cornetzi TaxID=471704 RepID=A0A151ISE1_9HYME|nr:hypothetical protein ALC57_18289 [Trachymyrmex cornetzi]